MIQIVMLVAVLSAAVYKLGMAAAVWLLMPYRKASS